MVDEWVDEWDKMMYPTTPPPSLGAQTPVLAAAGHRPATNGLNLNILHIKRMKWTVPCCAYVRTHHHRHHRRSNQTTTAIATRTTRLNGDTRSATIKCTQASRWPVGSAAMVESSVSFRSCVLCASTAMGAINTDAHSIPSPMPQ